VANLPFLDTSIFEPVSKTYIDPIKTSTSRINIANINVCGIIEDSQNSKTKNTTLSVNGSRIIPNLDTKLYLRATIPSKESDRPMTAIIIIKMYESKLSESKFQNK
tara:strand:- start:932 stop:1249 length:318 start_codon:yes stop_codon:yes gene_type:complete